MTKDDEGVEWKPLDVDQTIEKLKSNGFQYASAGDVRRLVNEVERLRMICKNHALGEMAALAQEMFPENYSPRSSPGAERSSSKREVAGSSPAEGTNAKTQSFATVRTPVTS